MDPSTHDLRRSEGSGVEEASVGSEEKVGNRQPPQTQRKAKAKITPTMKDLAVLLMMGLKRMVKRKVVLAMKRAIRPPQTLRLQQQRQKTPARPRQVWTETCYRSRIAY